MNAHLGQRRGGTRLELFLAGVAEIDDVLINVGDRLQIA